MLMGQRQINPILTTLLVRPLPICGLAYDCAPREPPQYANAHACLSSVAPICVHTGVQSLRLGLSSSGCCERAVSRLRHRLSRFR